MQGVLRTLDEMELLKSNIINYMMTTIGCTLSGAARQFGVAHGTVYQWQNGDIEFKRNVQWARNINREITNDFAESTLLSLIKERHPAATIFYAKSRMKHRGYSEKTFEDLPFNDEQPIKLITEELSVDELSRIYREEIHA